MTEKTTVEVRDISVANWTVNATAIVTELSKTATATVYVIVSVSVTANEKKSLKSH